MFTVIELANLETCPYCSREGTFRRQLNVNKKDSLFSCVLCDKTLEPYSLLPHRYVCVDFENLSGMDERSVGKLMQLWSATSLENAVRFIPSLLHGNSNDDWIYETTVHWDYFLKPDEIVAHQLSRSIRAFSGLKSSVPTLINNDTRRYQFLGEGTNYVQFASARWSDKARTVEEHLELEADTTIKEIEGYLANEDEEGYRDIVEEDFPVGESLLDEFYKIDPEGESKLERFVRSPEFRATPFISIRSEIWATIDREIEKTDDEYLEKVVPRDVDAVAVYGPFCEAMFLSDAFVGLLEATSLKAEQLAGTKLFCPARIEEFLDYLVTAK